jgi:hypothetical protein
MGPWLDPRGPLGDIALDPSGQPARERLGAAATFMGPFQSFTAFVRWRNR